MYEIEGLLDLADLMQLTRLDRPDLKPEPWVPVTQPRLARAKDAGRLFDEIRRGDILVHQPYESFRTSFEAFAAAAADDPDVIAMKTAVYRTSDDSTLVSALIDCAEDGKQAVCLVELKARFDERRNIEWSRELEQAGVHVVHGFPDMKIHAKMTLVVRREAGGLRRYVHIGTGNYHASTARLYEDVGIFTADEEIAADVADVFNYVTGFGRPQRFRKLLVAPFEMRTRLIEEIRAVADAAKAGETARIRLKLNNLVDPTMIDELYAASSAGASIDICARSICMLRPGVEGLSENIRVRSIVGRFLEHSRIYSFEAGDRTSMFIGSADLMPRNLDRRVEVLTPIENARSRQELQAILGSVFADDVHAWLLASDGSWSPAEPQKAGKRVDHQAAMMRRAQLRARRQSDGGSGQEPARHRTRARLPVRGAGQDEPRCASRSSMSDPIRRAFSSRRSTADGAVVPVAEERDYLRLGAEIERTGTLGAKKIAAAAATCGAFARRAAELGVERATVIVTAPGRQGASAPALTSALAEATALPVRVLSADDEGRLAYDGAVARASGELPEVVAVVDVGGGSTEIVVGTPLLGAAWIQSADLGSLRLTRAHLADDPPTRAPDRRRGARRSPTHWPTCARRHPISPSPSAAAPER